jgi:ATP-dependent DNA ligase
MSATSTTFFHVAVGNGKLPLIERKRALRELLPRRPRLIEQAIWVPGRGRDLFALVQQHDLEGIVAKRKDDAYTPSAKWIKIKNPRYSQAEGRGELFNPPKRSRDVASR